MIVADVIDICDFRCGKDRHRLCATGECQYFRAMVEVSNPIAELSPATIQNNIGQLSLDD